MVFALYTHPPTLFQNDEAVIHQTQHVLETVSRCFPDRIPPGMASHTANLLPIENIWSVPVPEAAQDSHQEDLEGD